MGIGETAHEMRRGREWLPSGIPKLPFVQSCTLLIASLSYNPFCDNPHDGVVPAPVDGAILGASLKKGIKQLAGFALVVGREDPSPHDGL